MIHEPIERLHLPLWVELVLERNGIEYIGDLQRYSTYTLITELVGSSPIASDLIRDAMEAAGVELIPIEMSLP